MKIKIIVEHKENKVNDECVAYFEAEPSKKVEEIGTARTVLKLIRQYPELSNLEIKEKK